MQCCNTCRARVRRSRAVLAYDALWATKPEAAVEAGEAFFPNRLLISDNSESSVVKTYSVLFFFVTLSLLALYYIV